MLYVAFYHDLLSNVTTHRKKKSGSACILFIKFTKERGAIVKIPNCWILIKLAKQITSCCQQIAAFLIAYLWMWKFFIWMILCVCISRYISKFQFWALLTTVEASLSALSIVLWLSCTCRLFQIFMVKNCGSRYWSYEFHGASGPECKCGDVIRSWRWFCLFRCRDETSSRHSILRCPV